MFDISASLLLNFVIQTAFRSFRSQTEIMLLRYDLPSYNTYLLVPTNLGLKLTLKYEKKNTITTSQ